MILADKIIKLRKKNGWSQEELAEKMNVSRQAVSKWEGAQTIPDIEKILQMSQLFGVTTDYLLKDEIEDEEFVADQPQENVRKITLAEANEYLDCRRRAAWQIALATFLCILSPITLIIMGGLTEMPWAGVGEITAGVVGLVALFALVLVAVPIFLSVGFKNAPYEFLDKKQPFELAYGVRGMVEERKKRFRSTYIRSNILATCLCIISPVPLIVSALTENEWLSVLMLTALLFLAGVGVFIFVFVGVQNESMQKLLQEGEYAPIEKSNMTEVVEGIYWGILTVVYFLWSFLSGDWHITWLVWVIGGVLSPVIELLVKRSKK